MSGRLLALGKRCLYGLDKRWVGPRYGLGAVAKGKICFPAEKSSSATAAHFVNNQCSEWATRTHSSPSKIIKKQAMLRFACFLPFRQYTKHPCECAASRFACFLLCRQYTKHPCECATSRHTAGKAKVLRAIKIVTPELFCCIRKCRFLNLSWFFLPQTRTNVTDVDKILVEDYLKSSVKYRTVSVRITLHWGEFS